MVKWKCKRGGEVICADWNEGEGFWECGSAHTRCVSRREWCPPGSIQVKQERGGILNERKESEAGQVWVDVDRGGGASARDSGEV